MQDDFERLAGAALPLLTRHAVMLTGDRELARDLVQDVLLKAYRHRAKVLSADHSNAYLRTMLTREFLSWRRRWSVRHITVVDDIDGPPSPDHADTLAIQQDVWQRLAELPARQRAVLVLRYYQGLDDAEIAGVLECAPGTVRGYASRALATLRLDTQHLDTQHLDTQHLDTQHLDTARHLDSIEPDTTHHHPARGPSS